MAIDSIGGAANQPAPQAAQGKSPDKQAKELTTITVHCDEEHKHDENCPHTVTTRPAPPTNSLLDAKA